MDTLRYVIEQVIANFKTWRIMHTDYLLPTAIRNPVGWPGSLRAGGCALPIATLVRTASSQKSVEYTTHIVHAALHRNPERFA
jgi:hypothetical protein